MNLAILNIYDKQISRQNKNKNKTKGGMAGKGGKGSWGTLQKRTEVYKLMLREREMLLI